MPRKRFDIADRLPGQSAINTRPLDDREQMKAWREQIVAQDTAFTAALDKAIQAKLEVCSTAISTSPGTRRPRYFGGHEFK